MKKKGFTLIELLAVIVILAIIALIAAPVVLGIIDDARKSAAKDSAYGLINAAKLHFAESLMDTNVPSFGSNPRSFTCDGSECTASLDENNKVTLSLDGTVPSGSFEISTDGKVTSDKGLTFNSKYCFKIEDNKVTGECSKD